MASHISQGSLRAIFQDGGANAEPNPVVQCVQIKPLPSQQQGGPTRYRVVFSDVNNFVQSMLATQANWVINENKLQKGCIVRLKSFQANFLKEKKILIVLDLEVLEHLGTMDKIGTPVALEDKAEEQDAKPQPTTISSNGFYGNSVPAKPQGQGQARSTGPSGGSSAHANIHPIEALSPYAHRWTIKARCTHKSEIKHWHNARGEGKLFNVNLLDESGEIRATGFNDQCDLLYDLFQENSVYYISSPCRVQLAKKQFSNLNNDYELSFERDSIVEKAEDAENVPQVRFSFTTIADLEKVEAGTTIDTIGILREVGEISQITSKTTNKPYDKRDLTLVDNSGFSVRLTIWGNTASGFDAAEDSVVAFKGVKVSDFGGRSLSLLSSGSMTVNPDVDDAHKLKGWYDAQGRTDSFATHQAMAGTSAAGGRKDQTKTIAQVKEENLGMSENAEYFNLKATIIFIREEVSYPACLSEGCNKKVIEDESEPGQWRCEKCNKTHDRPNHRYMMSMNVVDHTGQIWLSAFDDAGRLIVNMEANQLMQIKEEDTAKAGQVLQDANCRTWVFRVRAKLDTFRDEQRVRYSIASVQPVNFAAEANKLAGMIKLYNID